MIHRYIFKIREHQVMLSAHLAELYGVEPRALIQAVKRNKERFPIDFMFQLSENELENLKSQTVISSWGGSRTNPYAFTEQGVAMLSSVLRSKRAIQTNIAIMRTFVQLKQAYLAGKELGQKLNQLEAKYEKHDKQIQDIFEAIRQLISSAEKPRRQIGFHSQ